MIYRILYTLLLLWSSCANAAISCSTLTAAVGDTSNVNSYNTASVTPTGSHLVLVQILNTCSAACGANDVPSLSGNSETYVQINTQTNNTVRVTAFRAMVSSPSAGAITVAFTNNQTGAQWSIWDCSGTNTSGTNGSGAIVQNVLGSGTGTTASVTLAALSDSNNASFGAIGSAATGGFTAGSGYTLSQANYATPNGRGGSEWKQPGSTTVDVSWTGSVIWAEIGIEIAVPSVGGSAVRHRARVLSQ